MTWTYKDKHQFLGEELVVNGDFSDGENNWTLSDWVLTGGSIVCNGAEGNYAQNIVTGVVKDKYYQFMIDVTGTTGNTNISFYPLFGEGSIDVSANQGTYLATPKCVQTSDLYWVQIVGDTDFNGGRIDNLSIREVLDWDFETKNATEFEYKSKA
jgi:hypothetical protein